MWSDANIAGELQLGSRPYGGRARVEPFNPNRVQPASLDLTLGCEFMVPAEGMDRTLQASLIDPRLPSDMVERVSDAGINLMPHGFALGCTVECVTLGSDVAAVVDGKSSLARLGLAVHVTAGYIDPGWSGRITLEFVNHRSRPMRLNPGMPIAQIRFIELRSPSRRPYGTPGLGSKYQGADSVQGSRMHRNFEDGAR